MIESLKKLRRTLLVRECAKLEFKAVTVCLSVWTGIDNIHSRLDSHLGEVSHHDFGPQKEYWLVQSSIKEQALKQVRKENPILPFFGKRSYG
jgi:hypothetical protein